MGHEQPIAPSTLARVSQNDSSRSLALGKDSGSAKSKEVRQPFPCKVYEMLEDAEGKGFDDVVSWNKEGNGFTVHNKERFTKEIIPQYYNQTRYKSFQRQLSLYGFERSTEGSNKGLRYHEKLRRGCQHLCREMKPVGYKPRGQEFKEKIRQTPSHGTPKANTTDDSSTSLSVGSPNIRQGLPAVVSSNSIHRDNSQVPALVTENVSFTMPASIRPCTLSITERLVTTDDIAIFEGMPFYLMTSIPADAQKNSTLAPPFALSSMPSTGPFEGQGIRKGEIGFSVAVNSQPLSPSEVVPMDDIP